jgi:hypothetical protein
MSVGLLTFAPFDSCIACHKGDTTTALALEGEAQFVMAGIHYLTGVPLDQAKAFVDLYVHEEFGCDLGMVPREDIRVGVRLCRSCAARTGVEVGSPEAVPLFEQGDRGREEER